MKSRSPKGRGLSNRDVAVYALEMLGGEAHLVDTEDVALQCWLLFPAKFSWKKYPEYPDSEPGRSGLFDAAKRQYGALVTGSKDGGWMLTPSGKAWLEAKREWLEAELRAHATVGRYPVAGRVRRNPSIADNEMGRLRTTRAYSKFTSNEAQHIELEDFFQFMKVSQYMPVEKYQANLRAIRILVSNDPGLQELVAELDARFGSRYRRLADGEE